MARILLFKDYDQISERQSETAIENSDPISNDRKQNFDISSPNPKLERNKFNEDLVQKEYTSENLSSYFPNGKEAHKESRITETEQFSFLNYTGTKQMHTNEVVNTAVNQMANNSENVTNKNERPVCEQRSGILSRNGNLQDPAQKVSCTFKDKRLPMQ